MEILGGGLLTVVYSTDSLYLSRMSVDVVVGCCGSVWFLSVFFFLSFFVFVFVVME